VSIQVRLLRADRRVTDLVDPSGGHFDEAGDFDRLIPYGDTTYPVLGGVDPYDDLELPAGAMPQLIREVDRLLSHARPGPEHRGLLRLRTLAQACGQTTQGVLIFIGD
jgi:hypothetical protein